MAEEDSVFSRMKQARIAAGVPRRETISQERMAELVSEALGRVLHTTQWRRYETDREPPLDVIEAAARVSGLSREYIAFGVDASEIDIDPNVTAAQNRYIQAIAERAEREDSATKSGLPPSPRTAKQQLPEGAEKPAKRKRA